MDWHGIQGRELLVRQQARRRPGPDVVRSVHEHHVVGEEEGVVRVVGRQQHGHAVADQVPQQGQHAGLVVQVQGGRRLIEHQQRAPGRQGAGDEHQLLLAATQRRVRAVRQVGDADPLNGVLRSRAVEPPGHREPPDLAGAAHEDHVPDPVGKRRAAGLRHEPGGGGTHHPSLRGPEQTCSATDQGGLAAAVGPEHRGGAAAGDREGHAPEDPLAGGVGEAEAVQLKHRPRPFAGCGAAARRTPARRRER